MNHQVERDRFMATMGAEGMPSEISRRILRHAQTIQRCAELECSSEAADRDQVRCPGGDGPDGCLCQDYGSRLAGWKAIEAKPGALWTYSTPVERAGRVSLDKAREIATDDAALIYAHGTVPRHMVTSARAEQMIREWCGKAGQTLRRGDHFLPIFSGDPRGACVKVKVPSGRNDSFGGEGAICVPTR